MYLLAYSSEVQGLCTSIARPITDRRVNVHGRVPNNRVCKVNGHPP